MASILVDTGVWYALCDPRDGIITREKVDEVYGQILPHLILLPWPVAYETLRTRFVRNRIAVERFEREVQSSRVHLIDDTSYRDDAISLSIDSSLRRRRPLSFVDCVLRLMLDDIALHVHYLATFNIGDFYDVCASRRIEILTAY